MLLTLSFPANAQQPGKIPRIGYLTAAQLSALTERTGAFRQGRASLDTSKGRTLSLNGDLRKEKRIASLRLPQS